MALGKMNIAVEEETRNRFNEIQEALRRQTGNKVTQDDVLKRIVDVAYAEIIG